MPAAQQQGTLLLKTGLAVSSPVKTVRTYCTYPRRYVQADWAWKNTRIVDPLEVTNPSSNRAQCSLTLSMRLILLPLHQTSHQDQKIKKEHAEKNDIYNMQSRTRVQKSSIMAKKHNAQQYLQFQYYISFFQLQGCKTGGKHQSS